MITQYTTSEVELGSALAWLLLPGVDVRTVSAVSGPCEWCADLDCAATVRVYGTPRASVDSPVTVIEVGAACAFEVITRAIGESIDGRDIVVEVAC